ncbi:MAG TPA: M14 family zinc carboxypeptidase [Clostridiales bacterium]|nr:M14 family zinc carboxypeptidase [Clostridiales bacterium]HQK72732.1 M14 family zinc carboxypeptidase [Clostridiales bacterium]
MKKTLCALMILPLILAFPAAGASGPKRLSEGGFQYILDDSAAAVTGYNGAAAEVVVPRLLGGCPVRKIAGYAFAGLAGLQRVYLPDSLTFVGEGAFSGCAALTGAYFYSDSPELEAGKGVFDGCAPGFTVYYIEGKAGFGSSWNGYPAATFAIPVESLTLNTASLLWPVGKTGTFRLALLPALATNKAVAWSSSAPAVATADGGKVVAKSVGKAVLSCKALDGNGKQADCAIRVVPQAPAKLDAARRSATSVYLDWPAVTGAGGYEVYRAAGANGPYRKIKTVAGTAFIDTTLTSGNNYFYKVKAYKTVSAEVFRGFSSPSAATAGAPPLLGGVKIYAKGMSQSLFDAAYAPVKKDTDAPYRTVDISLNQFYHYAGLEQVMLALAKSDVVSLYQIGTTVDGRKMYSLEIGRGAENILFTAGVHASEACNPVYLLKFACGLVNNYYAGDGETLSLLENKKICMVAVCNPDGFEATLWGASAIRNKNLYIVSYAKTHANLYAYKANANGVDLNRAFPSYTAGVILNRLYPKASYLTAPSPKNYPGANLGSQPETQALVRWFKAKLPAATHYVDLHSQGRMIYRGKSQASDALNSLCFALGRDLGKVSGYMQLPITAESFGSGSDGTATDFAVEWCSGFVYNATLGRTIPAEGGIGVLVAKTAQTRYRCATATLETSVYVSPREKGIGIQQREWDEWRLFDTLWTACTRS